ncbi:MAG TPA: cell wall hydrolase [Novosphingobium sp.]|nr:cell wall hydrolase [Novosphingobium sp.]
MRTKVQWASAMALAATVLTALFSAQGSGAAASDVIPMLVEQGPSMKFVSEPVVQSILREDEGKPGAAADDSANSLAELVAEQPTDQPLDSQMRCLASAIYFEARGESLEGQLAVGRVIVNRAESGRFPSSYCGVVYQPAQFSFIRGNAMPKAREDSESWRRAVAIAHIAVDGSWKSNVTGALFFHATSVSPAWRLTRVARVDNHVFYR